MNGHGKGVYDILDLAREEEKVDWGRGRKVRGGWMGSGRKCFHPRRTRECGFLPSRLFPLSFYSVCVCVFSFSFSLSLLLGKAAFFYRREGIYYFFLVYME